MKPLQLLEEIRREVKFPRHGWASDTDHCIYLVFPILRATWELSPFELAFRRPTSSIPFSLFRDSLRMGYFQSMLFRILQVLGGIARAERLILSDANRNGAPIEEYGLVLEAKQLLPIWLDCFYFYFRILADRLTVALAPLVSTTPMSIFRKYRELLKEAESPSKDWHSKVNTDHFLRAIRENSDWYRNLVGPVYDTGRNKKGVRDSIAHSLADTEIIEGLGPSGKKIIQVRFCVTGDSDSGVIVPDIDILSTVTSVIRGFCDCLSSLPAEIWQERNFSVTDLAFRAEDNWPAVTRFFPSLP